MVTFLNIRRFLRPVYIYKVAKEAIDILPKLVYDSRINGGTDSIMANQEFTTIGPAPTSSDSARETAHLYQEMVSPVIDPAISFLNEFTHEPIVSVAILFAVMVVGVLMWKRFRWFIIGTVAAVAASVIFTFPITGTAVLIAGVISALIFG